MPLTAISNPDTAVWGNRPTLSIATTFTDPYNSDKSTIDTIHKMIEIALLSANSSLVTSIVNACLESPHYVNSAKNECDLVRSLYWWVKGHIRFVDDEDIVKRYLVQLGYTDDVLNTPQGSIDLLITPEVMLAMPQPMGDCDDFSMMLATLLVNAGIRCWYVAVAANGDQPERFSHVYVKAVCKGPDGQQESVALDASHGRYPGWEARQVFRRMEWSIN